jgi:hypothetical protein
MRRLAGTVFGLWAICSGAAMGDAGPQGEIRLLSGAQSPPWVGQEVELYLEMWSNGFSFSDQWFVLPEVAGAYLLEADASTVKLSETRGAEQWQGLRYTLLLYPQRPGLIRVPGFDVRFSSSAGFGSVPGRFESRTEALSLEARLPPGADSGALLVTSASFSLETAWSPRPGEGQLSLRVGDALSLSVERRAGDVPGMVFEPLPPFEIDGLAAYPGTPRVEDRIDRGILTGSRRDSVTFVAQRPGTFVIPELRFQWWDPVTETLEEQRLASLELQVSRNPAYAGSGAGAAPGPGRGFPAGLILAVVLVMVLAVWPGRIAAQWALGRWRRWRERVRQGEPWAFRQALRQCRRGSPGEAYAAVSLWLSRRGRRDRSLLDLAARVDSPELGEEAVRLQRQLLAPDQARWEGRRLAQLLRAIRSEQGHRADRSGALPPLNPG